MLADEDERSPNNEPQRVNKKKFLDVYLLGLAIKLGGTVAAWHNGFATGFWAYLICVVIIAIGYSCLTLCISEMISAVAFPGGYYGYVRCGIGPLSGFLVGCSGLIEAIFFLSASVLKISQAFIIIFDLSDSYMPLLWFITYVLVLIIHIRGGRLFWTFMECCTVISLLLLLIYLFGSMPNLDLGKWAYGNAGYHPETLGGLKNLDVNEFFSVFRLPAWMFLGVDLLSLACDEVEDTKIVLPAAISSVMATIAILAVWLTFTVGCQSPGLSIAFNANTIESIFPLSAGYHHALGISLRAATALVIIPLFGSCTGYMFAVGRQLHSMATSGLFPPFLKMTYGSEQTPIAAMIAGTILGLGSLFGMRRYDDYMLLLQMAVFGGCPVYLAMFACFSVFRSRYNHLRRGFVNPFGLFSAALGSVIFLLMLITLIKYQTETRVMTAYFSYMGAMILYYYLYAEKRQFFSDKEQSIFLKTYVINFNTRNQAAAHRRFALDCRALVLDTFAFFVPSTAGREQSEERITTWESTKQTTSEPREIQEVKATEASSETQDQDVDNKKPKTLNLRIVNKTPRQRLAAEKKVGGADMISNHSSSQQDEDDGDDDDAQHERELALIFANDQHGEDFYPASRRRTYELLLGNEKNYVSSIVMIEENEEEWTAPGGFALYDDITAVDEYGRSEE